MSAPNAALEEAVEDARRRGNGYVRIIRITSEQLRLMRVDPSLVVILDDPTTHLEHLRAVILMIPCSYCMALPGESCATAAGARMGTFHKDRSGPAYDAWRLGHVDGVVDGVRRFDEDRKRGGS